MAIVLEQFNPVCIGCDIGKIDDPTALCVAEAIRVETGRYRRTGEEPTLGRHDEKGYWIPPKGFDPIMITRYITRSIGRLPLGTSYPKVAEKIADLLCNELLEKRKIRMLIDVTGVGQAVYDDVLQEISERKADGKIKPGQSAYEASIQAISFVHGETYNRTKGTLGKKFMVSRIQSLLQNGKIDGPDIPEMTATCEELKVYQVKISERGTDQYGAFRTGEHDDLATALGLSTLEDPYANSVTYSERVY